ncbi:hypothetical protein [Aeromonas phage ZPAH34]|uniref:hypothetical protein n=1 Tax=Aeromonas phage ZPAH34 TaxID=2924888 RepID=UPI0023292C98|nr:hypothetical protein PQD16_gp063 [Aeromonas phage ZPAH34]UOX39620.1 hypothetical protein [Aeromonas phage ZPAH34]
MKTLKPPVVETRSNVVEEQTDKVKGMDTALGVPTEVIPTTPATIYKNGFDKFILFLKGEYKNSSPEERTDFQIAFMKDIVNLLQIDGNQAHEVLDHWVVKIAENKPVFGQNSLYAPLYEIEKQKLAPAMDIDRYKKFMLFMVMLSANIKVRDQFINGFDVAKLVHMFPANAAQTLNNYAYR